MERGALSISISIGFKSVMFCVIWMSCKGICYRYKVSKPTGMGRYQAGQKRCNLCDIFIKWDGLSCPCCKFRLRTTSRYTKYKEKFLELQRI